MKTLCVYQIIIKIIFFFFNTYKKMDKNKFSRHCTTLLIDGDNYSKLFISEKNKYYIKYGDNRSICIF